MQDTIHEVRRRAINDIWVSLGRDHDSTDEAVWPHQDHMRLPCPFVFEDEGISLSQASQDSVDLIHVHYFDDAPDDGAFHSITAFDLGDDFFYVIEFGGDEEILWAVTPPSESRDTFARIEQRWIEEHIRPDGLPFPSDFEALDTDQPWMARQLTEALMARGEAGMEEIWEIISDKRELERTDPYSVLAFWRKSVEHGENGPRTGQIPGLADKTFDSPEFNQWLETTNLSWSDTHEPIYADAAQALRLVCFYLAVPSSFNQG
ncbi:MAG TPA: hypothetical protein VHG52_07935 [Thermomicrobiales bacterium]|nr:hypothetical protein [Thermomicrobiales bacterium]